ncbi:SMP-30/gluconolactonase/LRE family protein [Herbidospora sp. NEAU-GS84]|uniref:SMP-30/gluconolactonase/LRE family protein n=1 Tax=Herbidospora solisilvae TaxID=2696284 RepID=A0A7C9JC33_9ACTN|nr:SMP-30/gluconolactonase/LRE family protein [Herbidospora solisilvae]NAS21263.1 SMP-30/gluconolactonase/LRE family protein [Herbidospora solisilvae]
MKLKRWALIGLGVPALLAGAFLVFLRPPVDPFDPITWDPGPPSEVPQDVPAAGVTPIGALRGPEDLAVDGRGNVYTGLMDGRLVRIVPGGRPETFAHVGGRPLGLVFDAQGNLLVANHGVGLQSVAPDGTVTLLTDTADGEPIRFANDLAVAADGTVYFSDSNSRLNNSTLPGSAFSVYDFLEGRPRGRLLRYDPAAKTTTTLVRDLYFPNGVVVTDDQKALLVVESTRYRVTRVSLDDGTTSTFLDHVPGIGDGFTRLPDGRLLLPVYDRVPLLDDRVLPNVWTRRLAVRLPAALLADEDDPPAGSILVLTPDGRIERRLSGIDPAPANVVPYEEGWLLGSLQGGELRTMPAVSWCAPGEGRPSAR